MLADGRVKASVQIIDGLKEWGSVRYVEEHLTFTFAPWREPANSDSGTVDVQLEVGEHLVFSGTGSTAPYVVTKEDFDAHGTDGPQRAFMTMTVSDGNTTFQTTTHAFVNGTWSESKNAQEGDLGSRLILSSELLNPGDAGQGEAGTVTVLFDIVSGGITVGYVDVEVLVIVMGELPALDDDTPAPTVVIVAVGQDTFGDTLFINLPGIDRETVFSTIVDGREVTVAYTPDTGLLIPSSLAGSGLIGLLSGDGGTILMLVAFGAMDDVPSAGVLTF